MAGFKRFLCFCFGDLDEFLLGSGHFGIITEENAGGFECFAGGCQVTGVPAAFGDGEIHVADAQGGFGGFRAFGVSIDDFLKGSG